MQLRFQVIDVTGHVPGKLEVTYEVYRDGELDGQYVTHVTYPCVRDVFHVLRENMLATYAQVEAFPALLPAISSYGFSVGASVLPGMKRATGDGSSVSEDTPA